MAQPKRCHLEHMKATSFGRFANLIVGPFKPGMNVVYGPNEAGKTTINELVRGVMFGWKRNTAGVNAYVPENAERSGSLFFASEEDGLTTELKRVHNTTEPEDEWGVLADIDAETYDTMFALTSEELQELNRHTEVTAHLLTAGSGTTSSPAHALDEVRGRIRKLLSHSANYPDSITNLREERDELREAMQRGLREAEQFREKEEYLKELQPRKETLDATQHALNEEIEGLKAALVKLDALDESIAETQDTLAQVQFAQSEEWLDPESVASPEVRRLAQLGQKEEYRLADTLEELDEQRLKLEHLVDNARNTANRSRADHELAMQDRDLQADAERARNQKRVKLAAAIILPLGLAILGVYLFLQGQNLGSVSYTAIGIFVVVAAMFTATAGLLMNLQPSKVEEEVDERRKKTAWVMQQDERALQLAEQNLDDHLYATRNFLENNHLTEAEGSLRRARRMLEDARELRSATNTAAQNRKAVELQQGSLEEQLANLNAQRRALCREKHLPRNAQRTDIEATIQAKESDRARAMQLAGETNTRFGEVTQELSQAREAHAFDEAKIQAQVVEARLQQQYTQLATLLVEQRALEDAIASWEKKSQPQVYKKASELFSHMTGGKWQQVRINAEDEIEVVDAVKSTFSPTYLSLGTRQQLYLALRIALLLTATNVGRALPILCDDILVNFDATRRVAAAQALLELAESRQVILFTCHPEIVELMRGCSSGVNVVEL